MHCYAMGMNVELALRIDIDDLWETERVPPILAARQRKRCHRMNEATPIYATQK